MPQSAAILGIFWAQNRLFVDRAAKVSNEPFETDATPTLNVEKGGAGEGERFSTK